jgi:hypothetical protein
MALKFGVSDVPPEFSLLDFIEKAKEECLVAGVSPLCKFDLDLKHQGVPGVWRPSSLRRCMRKQVYKATRVPKSDNPIDLKRQHLFDRGHVFGAWFAAYVLLLEGKYGFSVVNAEVVLHDEETEIGGKADIVLLKDGHKYVVEVKSKDNAATMRSIKPNPIDLAQLNDYQKMWDAKAGWLVYFGVDYIEGRGKAAKTGIQAKEFFHRFDKKLWEDTEKKVQMLRWFQRDQTKLAPKTSNTFLECGGCEWRSLCDQEVTPQKAKT